MITFTYINVSVCKACVFTKDLIINTIVIMPRVYIGAWKQTLTISAYQQSVFVDYVLVLFVHFYTNTLCMGLRGSTSYIQGDRTCHWNRSPYEAWKYVNRWWKLSEIYDKVNKLCLSSFLVFLAVFYQPIYLFGYFGIPLLHNIPN